MSEIPSLDARATTSGSLTTDHGAFAGAADASADGATAGAQLVSEHTTLGGELGAGGAAGDAGASGWLSGGLDVALAHVGSLVLQLKAMFEGALPF